MSVGAWVGAGVAALLLVGGLSLFAYGGWQLATTEREGVPWSEQELYECELAPSCDEGAAGEEARLWRQTNPAGEADTMMVLGMIMLVMAMVVAAASVPALLGLPGPKGGN